MSYVCSTTDAKGVIVRGTSKFVTITVMREPGGNASGRVRGVTPGRGNVSPSGTLGRLGRPGRLGCLGCQDVPHVPRVPYVPCGIYTQRIPGEFGCV